MRVPREMEVHRASPRLLVRRFGERRELWTITVGSPPAVYGERWREEPGRTLRSFEPARSKLAAGVDAGWRGPLPRPGERWLYLGAASGSTASHVADLVGASGGVYAVERSVRPFARLLATSDRWPNLLPILADARDPVGFADLVPPVAGVYADIAQPDQVDIVRRNVELFSVGPGAAVLVALKTSSMGRDRTPGEHLDVAEEALHPLVDLARPVGLAPSHRAHYLIGGAVRGRATTPTSARPVRSPRGPPPGRRRS
jgi:fibrillarin-like pre-rRNA processing protein